MVVEKDDVERVVEGLDEALDMLRDVEDEAEDLLRDAEYEDWM